MMGGEECGCPGAFPVAVAETAHKKARCPSGGMLPDAVHPPDMGTSLRGFETREMEKKVIRAGLAGKIKRLNSLLDLHHAYQVWGPFLWVRIRMNVVSGNQHGMHQVELVVTNPLTTHRLFVARERVRSFFSKNVNDQNTYYPILNSFISWIRENGGHLHPSK